MPSPTVDELQDGNHFQLLAEMGHKEIAQFAAEYYWRRKSWITLAHILFASGVAGTWVYVGLRNKLAFGAWMDGFGFAVLAALVILLPIHELIHGAAYKASGAKDVRYKVAWRQFCAYAIAHNFVASSRVFRWVAVLPFLVINAVLILGACWFSSLQFFLLVLLLIHTAGTSGDFAMLNFLWLNRREEVYTYDDAGEQKSYFYRRI